MPENEFETIRIVHPDIDRQLPDLILTNDLNSLCEWTEQELKELALGKRECLSCFDWFLPTPERDSCYCLDCVPF